MAQREHADIVISGAGFVGQALALTFAVAYAPLDFKILLLDRKDPAGGLSARHDARAFAITSTSRNMLKALGLWAELKSATQPMSEIKVTDTHLGDKLRPALLHFGDNADGTGPPAHMLENSNLKPVLYKAVGRHSSIVQKYGHSIERYESEPGETHLVLDDGSEVSTKLLVAADGKHSRLRSMAGIETVGWDYGQHGIVATISHERPHNGCAEEHFLPAGPFAILPLTGNRVSLVWTEEADKAIELVNGSDADFKTAMDLRFGSHLGRTSVDGPRMSFPLAVSLARTYVSERLALVGDAAHAVHPIAGLGFNLGLRDVAVLTEAVAEAARLGLDFGGPAALDPYERGRRFDALMVAAATDGLNRLFSNDNPMLRALRDLGMSAVDRIGPLKSFFIDQAVGHNTPLPAIMRDA